MRRFYKHDDINLAKRVWHREGYSEPKVARLPIAEARAICVFQHERG
jgi:hypothetical protein